ncbi:hypothetical protein Noda2021_02290 [Candidatus Dependentiae bacterium Noda2021]|nr:hypothetical protein Noda2021_02290 [Candidatus Dependentiae bacterium Noda2021]
MSRNKTLLLSLFIFFSCAIYHYIPGSLNAYNHTNVGVPVLFDKDKATANQTLLSLLKALSIEHDNSLQDIVSVTQKAWLRKAGQERWDLDTAHSAALNSLIISHCQQLNMIEEIIPSTKDYTYALVMGATLDTIRNRFAFLIKLIKLGIRFDSIVFLTGQRPLNPTLESAQKLLDITKSSLPCNPNWSLQGPLPCNETEMIRMVIDQAALDSAIKSKIVVVDAPCKINDAGNVIRPTTGDTFASWLKTNPPAGKALIISSQPYVGYQDMVARSYLPSTCTVESAGCRYEEPIIDSDLLDTLARWIYQTNLYLKQQ